MKSFFGFIAISLLSMNLIASGKGAPSSDGYGTPQCAAYDAGKKEEHSPHRSCEDCKSSGHGSCELKCFNYDYTCTSKTQVEEFRTVIDPVTKQSREESHMVDREFKATGRTRDEARQRAQWDCESSTRGGWGGGGNLGRGGRGGGGYSSSYCQDVGCTENSYESSNRSCR